MSAQCLSPCPPPSACVRCGGDLASGWHTSPDGDPVCLSCHWLDETERDDWWPADPQP